MVDRQNAILFYGGPANLTPSFPDFWVFLREYPRDLVNAALDGHTDDILTCPACNLDLAWGRWVEIQLGRSKRV